MTAQASRTTAHFATSVAETSWPARCTNVSTTYKFIHSFSFIHLLSTRHNIGHFGGWVHLLSKYSIWLKPTAKWAGQQGKLLLEQVAWTSLKFKSHLISFRIAHYVIRLRNDLYCVGWGVKLYSLTHSLTSSWTSLCMTFTMWCGLSWRFFP